MAPLSACGSPNPDKVFGQLHTCVVVGVNFGMRRSLGFKRSDSSGVQNFSDFDHCDYAVFG